MDWYPHSIESYDTDTLHLTAAQDGVYSRLLRWYYEKERSLPDSDPALAAIARIGIDEWLAMAPIIRAFFEARASRVTNARTLHQKRCDAYILERSRKRVGQNERQKKHRKNNMVGDDYEVSRVSHAPHIHTQKVVDRTQSLTETEIKTKTETLERVGEFTKTDALLAFEDWWCLVPRKVGKGHAQKAYLRALTKTDPTTLAEGMRRYDLERTGQDPQFTVHPATWLNGERWNDDPAPPAHTLGNYNGTPSLVSVGREILADDHRKKSHENSWPGDSVRGLHLEHQPAADTRRIKPGALPDE